MLFVVWDAKHPDSIKGNEGDCFTTFPITMRGVYENGGEDFSVAGAPSKRQVEVGNPSYPSLQGGRSPTKVSPHNCHCETPAGGSWQSPSPLVNISCLLTNPPRRLLLSLALHSNAPRVVISTSGRNLLTLSPRIGLNHRRGCPKSHIDSPKEF